MHVIDKEEVNERTHRNSWRTQNMQQLQWDKQQQTEMKINGKN